MKAHYWMLTMGLLIISFQNCSDGLKVFRMQVGSQSLDEQSQQILEHLKAQAVSWNALTDEQIVATTVDQLEAAKLLQEMDQIGTVSIQEIDNFIFRILNQASFRNRIIHLLRSSSPSATPSPVPGPSTTPTVSATPALSPTPAESPTPLPSPTPAAPVTQAASPGMVRFLIPGSYQFTIPPFATALTVKVWGGGGATQPTRGGCALALASNGKESVFETSPGIVAGGGQNGGSGGAGGIAHGGDINLNGASGLVGLGYNGGSGGSSPNGGQGGAANSNGGYPGGGSGAYSRELATCRAGSGGGAFSMKTFSPGQLAPGANIDLKVGAGGSAVSLLPISGGHGQIEISWQ